MQVYCLTTELTGLLQDILNKDKALYIRATGESMLPTIRDQEVVKIVPLYGEIRRNEILLYKDNRGKPIMHRVINVLQDNPGLRYCVRGDNSWYGGEIIEKASILGKVVFVVKDGKEIEVGKIKGRQLFICARILKQNVINILEKFGIKC